jgi:hypothetical protein
MIREWSECGRYLRPYRQRGCVLPSPGRTREKQRHWSRTMRRDRSSPVRDSGTPQGSNLTAIRRGTNEILSAIHNLWETKILSILFSGPSASADRTMVVRRTSGKGNGHA